MLDFKIYNDPEPFYEDLRRYYKSSDGNFRIHPCDWHRWTVSIKMVSGWDYHWQDFHTLKEAKAFCEDYAQRGRIPICLHPMRYAKSSGIHQSACRQICIAKNGAGWKASFRLYKGMMSKEPVGDYVIRHGLEAVKTKRELLERIQAALEIDPIWALASIDESEPTWFSQRLASQISR